MALLRARVMCAIFALLPFSVLTAAPADQMASTQQVDRSVKPGDDFYRYANGVWLRTSTIPPGRSSFDTRAVLTERTTQRVRDLIQIASAAHSSDRVTQKVGDYYASFMDQQGIEAKGLTPLSGELAGISAITTKKSLSAYLGTTLDEDVDGLSPNADHVFGAWVNQGFTNSDHYVFHLAQGGLGMPDRDAYLDPSPKMAELRAQYTQHIAAMLKLAGVADADSQAPRVLSLEIQIASAHAPDSDAADVFKQNNPWKRSDFEVKAPGMDWEAYFSAAALAGQTEFIVWQPSAVVGTSGLVATEDVEVWKDYLRFHLIEHYAPVLPSAVRAEYFNFHGKTLAGAQQSPDRSDDAIAATNAALGQAVGQLYTRRYFPPEAKAAAQAVVSNLIVAYRARILNLTWMSPETKQKALAKLDALKVGVGYPDTWIDYSTLDVVRGDAVGNLRRAEAFNHQRDLAKLKQPVDPGEWRIDPQVVGAIIMFSPNAEFFSAAILQPPYFDAHGDAAANYGSAGAGIAHEISHSFDELGNIYDAEGRLGNWWTTQDVANYHAAAAKVAAQFDSYCPIAGVCVKGKQVLVENLADLAGLLTAHDAYLLSLKGKPDVVVDGLTGDQRFFVAFAQRWRKLQTEAALRQQIAGDSHAPGEYRSDTVRNVESWYQAYKIAASGKLYLKPDQRVVIW